MTPVIPQAAAPAKPGNSPSQYSPDAFCTSGPSPTVHLIGPGSVGRALLALLDGTPFRLVGVTDTTATIHDRQGLDPLAVAAWKSEGKALETYPRAGTIPVELAIELVDADIVVDTTPTDFARKGRAVARGNAVLRHPARLALAAKDGLCAAVESWLGDGLRASVGFNAVLGGTGLLLRRELTELRSAWRSIACAGNASTSAIISAIEAGFSLEEGIERARAAGCLEADPELDLRGVDSAVKLAVVAGALTGSAFDPRTIPCEDIRSLDLDLVRKRAEQGYTTRLVGRIDRGGGARRNEASVRYEELDRSSPLAVPEDRVVYQYELEDGHLRIHTGAGIGPIPTAQAVLADIEAFAATASREGGLSR